MDKGIALVFLGAPGAGKGTVISFVAKGIPLEQVSTGDLVRARAKEDAEFKAQVEEKMNRGELLSDEIVEALLIEACKGIPLETAIALDGYPRTEKQAESLEKILPELNRKLERVIYLKVSEETVMQRLGGRRQCRKCSAIYNIVGMKPRVEGKCDKCGGTLFIRDDDRPEVIRKRLEEYREKTGPLVEYYRNKGLLFEVDANNEATESSKAILQELGEG